MSINAEVSRTLVIESPLKLYEILHFHKDLTEKCIELKVFMDQMNLQIEGCNCDSLGYVAGAVNQYVELKDMSRETQEILKKTVGCDKLIFKMTDLILFEF